jgi:hypothetical protein
LKKHIIIYLLFKEAAYNFNYQISRGQHWKTATAKPAFALLNSHSLLLLLAVCGMWLVDAAHHSESEVRSDDPVCDCFLWLSRSRDLGGNLT